VSSTDVFIAAVGAVGGLGGSYAAIMSYLSTRGDRRTMMRKEAVDNAISVQLKPVTDLTTKLSGDIGTLSLDSRRISSVVDRNSTAVTGLGDRITVLETKMDVFWRNVGVELARVLHSPNPARAHVDALLEALTEGRLTPVEREELKGLLQYIRDYHSGDKSDFPIYAGDQVAAAILLQTMLFVGAGKT